jgi:hypothetical protein
MYFEDMKTVPPALPLRRHTLERQTRFPISFSHFHPDSPCPDRHDLIGGSSNMLPQLPLGRVSNSLYIHIYSI